MRQGPEAALQLCSEAGLGTELDPDGRSFSWPLGPAMAGGGPMGFGRYLRILGLQCYVYNILRRKPPLDRQPCMVPHREQRSVAILMRFCILCHLFGGARQAFWPHPVSRGRLFCDLEERRAATWRLLAGSEMVDVVVFLKNLP